MHRADVSNHMPPNEGRVFAAFCVSQTDAQTVRLSTAKPKAAEDFGCVHRKNAANQLDVVKIDVVKLEYSGMV